MIYEHSTTRRFFEASSDRDGILASMAAIEAAFENYRVCRCLVLASPYQRLKLIAV